MGDPPMLVKPNRLSTPAPSHLLSARQRAADDFFSYIEPAAVVDALALPAGNLRGCLDGASVAERDFAMRTALASQRIWEWLNELGQWRWPSEGGPGGFEKPSGTRRKLFAQVTVPAEDAGKEYMGSLLAEEVARYERRIKEITWAMDELALEEIKDHVMTDYIMPLSRPSTPTNFNPDGSTPSALTSYQKMDDLSAVITAVVVQTLPNLARLTRLLQIWSIRLTVLHQVNLFLQAARDAEGLLGECWEATSHARWDMARPAIEDIARQELRLTQEEFKAKKDALAQKVAQTGQTLDYMLDCLEGSSDTLPDDWLNRMEDVELGYSEWVAACERGMSEAQWTKAIESSQASCSPLSAGDQSLTDERASQPHGLHVADLSNNTIALPMPSKSADVREPYKTKPSNGALLDSDEETYLSVFNAYTPSGHNSVNPDSIADIDGANDEGVPLSMAQPSRLNAESGNTSGQDRTGGAEVWSSSEGFSRDDDAMSPVEEEHEEHEEHDLDLPPLRSSTRRNSMVSQTSTVIHKTSRYFNDLSSDPPEVSASPTLTRSRLRETIYPDADSPPSSPPETQPYTRESSLALLDSPMITAIPGDDSFFRSPVEGSFLDDFEDSFAISERSGPIFRRESAGDEQLREQISQIIESIPAKIKLSTELPTINLNPPGLQLPQLRMKNSREPLRGSVSGLSNRTATPSFTLSPVRTKQRHRGQQPIKVYHLSRSNGEAPIKLFIRCVGERGERVMVRVGGGWADLSEYLKEYASHHGRRSSGKDKAKVEIRDIPRSSVGPCGSSPPSRPPSVAADRPPVSPLNVRKTRRSVGAMSGEAPILLRPRTPANTGISTDEAPPSNSSVHSTTSSRLSWMEDDNSILGLAGPRAKKIEMSEENKAWVESVNEKVRMVSGDRRSMASLDDYGSRFGELGKVGGTKRLFRKA